MTDEQTNVVEFKRPEPKPVEPPPDLQFIEVRLNEEDCSLTLSTCDEAGDVVVLKFTLACVPLDFDLNRLRTAWARWRGSATAAS